MSESILEALLVEARRQSQLLALLALAPAREAAMRTLVNDKQRAAYKLSDGTRSARQIASEIGASKTSVADWWREWRRLGLVGTVDERAQIVFTLDELDLPSTDSAPAAKRK